MYQKNTFLYQPLFLAKRKTHLCWPKRGCSLVRLVQEMVHIVDESAVLLHVFHFFRSLSKYVKNYSDTHDKHRCRENVSLLKPTLLGHSCKRWFAQCKRVMYPLKRAFRSAHAPIWGPQYSGPPKKRQNVCKLIFTFLHFYIFTFPLVNTVWSASDDFQWWNFPFETLINASKVASQDESLPVSASAMNRTMITPLTT